MGKIPFVQKASGETEPFSQQKLEASLRRAGAKEDTIAWVVRDIKSWLEDGVSTQKIYRRAFSRLRAKRGGAAARYNLKKAIIEMGPSGYPFEHFIGQIMKEQGFAVETGQIVAGYCLEHEVDVIATGGGQQHLMECKFHNNQGKVSSVKVPLYIHSRMEDIIKKRKKTEEFRELTFTGWVVTNTRFSADALVYGKCSGLMLLGWDYPPGNSLKVIIERHRIFPVTTLASLSKKQKRWLTQNGIVLCRQLPENPGAVQSLDLTPTAHQKLMDELEALITR